jgi:hypothetical protein
MAYAAKRRPTAATRATRAIALALLARAATPAPATFAHPGVVVGQQDISAARARLAAGAEPTTSFFRAASSLPQGRADYVPTGPPANGTISCGYYDKPDIGCSSQMRDVDAAYTQALLFALGGYPALAAASRGIVNLYSAGLKRYTNNTDGTCCGNEALQAAWVGAKFARTAELLRWTPNSGWTAADTAAFAAMMYEVHLPLLVNGTPANGNWEASFIEAMIGTAVFSENATLYDRSVAYWRGRMPSYFYTTSDGPSPPLNPQPNCSPQPYCEWYNQTVFDARVNGVCQETCRDLGHMQMGFAAFTNGAATATLQGDDLLRAEAPRLFAAAEFVTALQASGRANETNPLLCNNRPGGVLGGMAPTFELAHALFARLGMDDANTRSWLRERVRPNFLSSGEFYICGPWETISHGLPL